MLRVTAEDNFGKGNYRIIWKYLFVNPFTKNDPLSTTFCYISSEDREEVGVGFACQSQKDKFDRDKARRVSLTMALTDAGFFKEEREQIWNQYFQRKGKVLTKNVTNVEIPTNQ